MIVIDVWGGPRNLVHIARFIRPPTEALAMAGVELNAGYLVNLRAEHAWGSYSEFDARVDKRDCPPKLTVVR